MSNNGRFLSRAWFVAYFGCWLLIREIIKPIPIVRRMTRTFQVAVVIYQTGLLVAVWFKWCSLDILMGVWSWTVAPLDILLEPFDLRFQPVLWEMRTLDAIFTRQPNWDMVLISELSIAMACFSVAVAMIPFGMLYQMSDTLIGKEAF